MRVVHRDHARFQHRERAFRDIRDALQSPHSSHNCKEPARDV
jgi:hypothetical protein